MAEQSYQYQGNWADDEWEEDANVEELKVEKPKEEKPKEEKPKVEKPKVKPEMPRINRPKVEGNYRDRKVFNAGTVCRYYQDCYVSTCDRYHIPVCKFGREKCRDIANCKHGFHF